MTDWTFEEKRYANRTPGEWREFYKHKYDEYHVSVPINGPTAMKLALFPNGIPTRNAADARLIADAPRLLSALVEARAEVERLRGLIVELVAEDTNPDDTRWEQLWIEARKIAEGRNHER